MEPITDPWMVLLFTTCCLVIILGFVAAIMWLDSCDWEKK